MNVFLSWSGETSLAVATALYNWLPQVINAIDPWVSSVDIRKGQRWSAEIAGALKDAKIGIFCLSRDNTDSQWLLFEAGAISKSVDQSYACTYLLGLKPSDVTGPLAQFQATVANKADTFKLVETINKALGNLRTESQLAEAFGMWWPKLDEKLDESIRSSQRKTEADTPKRTESDLLEEILSISRQLALDSTRIDVTLESVLSSLHLYHRVVSKSVALASTLDEPPPEWKGLLSGAATGSQKGGILDLPLRTSPPPSRNPPNTTTTGEE